MPNLDDLKIFSGATHSTLALDVSAYVDIPLGKATVSKFGNGNTFVQYQENIRQQDVFIVQPFGHPVNDSIMELLIMIDAAKRASAGRITAVIPYYAYGRTDKKDQPRVPITARLLADLIEVAGAHRVLTLDMHAGQIQGFFNIPVDRVTENNSSRYYVMYFPYRHSFRGPITEKRIHVLFEQPIIPGTPDNMPGPKPIKGIRFLSKNCNWILITDISYEIRRNLMNPTDRRTGDAPDQCFFIGFRDPFCSSLKSK